MGSLKPIAWCIPNTLNWITLGDIWRRSIPVWSSCKSICYWTTRRYYRIHSDIHSIIYSLLSLDDKRYVKANAGCKHFDVHGGPENIPVSRFSFDAKVQLKP